MGVQEKVFVVEVGLGSVLRRRLGGFLAISRSSVESVCGLLTRALDDGTARNSSMRSVSGTGSILTAYQRLHTRRLCMREGRRADGVLKRSSAETVTTSGAMNKAFSASSSSGGLASSGNIATTNREPKGREARGSRRRSCRGFFFFLLFVRGNTEV